MTELEKTLTERGYDCEDLDGVVHSVASLEATRVNNEGLEAQIGYLKRMDYTDDQIVRMIEEQG
ncbi:hypothetical protein [Vibrio mediterranei]|uniref:hypothetical protein n=1 Tax=Vibrio mediterranei TaxID=689 RepID=UPI004069868C